MIHASALTPLCCGISSPCKVMQASPAHAVPHVTLSRRVLLPLLASAPLPWCVRSASAAPALSTLTDDEYGVSFALPTGWKTSESELSGGRKLIAAADPADIDFNVFIAYTPIAADYTSLGSFGNIDSVGLTLLPQCSGSSCTLAADGIQGKMLEEVAQAGAYVFDYSIEQVGQPIRRLRTLFSVQTEVGRGKNLVTLTAQCKQARYEELAPTLRAVIESFKYTGGT
eukprot:CAMPEP_0119357302 /NCGR_PEP_ID=MMETSP1334-20130426/5718_1 /TAXON_ID=127549 /ORGANISM="Calcidiscus leptoporus, Strain RCC1130" /LENGTH=226 /DNA_ID=CAMNT_0007371511 /DNA_START=25 /DNA_END=705 /DNA_ORIENTATION=-